MHLLYADKTLWALKFNARLEKMADVLLPIVSNAQKKIYSMTSISFNLLRPSDTYMRQ